MRRGEEVGRIEVDVIRSALGHRRRERARNLPDADGERRGAEIDLPALDAAEAGGVVPDGAGVARLRDDRAGRHRRFVRVTEGVGVSRARFAREGEHDDSDRELEEPPHRALIRHQGPVWIVRVTSDTNDAPEVVVVEESPPAHDVELPRPWLRLALLGDRRRDVVQASAACVDGIEPDDAYACRDRARPRGLGRRLRQRFADRFDASRLLRRRGRQKLREASVRRLASALATHPQEDDDENEQRNGCRPEAPQNSTWYRAGSLPWTRNTIRRSSRCAMACADAGRPGASSSRFSMRLCTVTYGIPSMTSK